MHKYKYGCKDKYVKSLKKDSMKWLAWWLGSFLLPENEDSGVPTRKYMGAFGGIPENMSNLWQLGKYAHRRQDRTDGSSGECSARGLGSPPGAPRGTRRETGPKERNVPQNGAEAPFQRRFCGWRSEKRLWLTKNDKRKWAGKLKNSLISL